MELPARGSARAERGLEDLPSGGWTGLGQPSVLSLDDCGQADLGLQRAPSAVIGQSRPRWRPFASAGLARISSWTVPNSPSRQPPQPSRAFAAHSFFAKFSHFPGCSVERQSKRRINRRAAWDADAFERVPFLSVSRLSRTQAGRWRGGWRLFSNPAPFPRPAGAAALARSAKPPAPQGTGRPRRSPPAWRPDAGPLLPWPRKFPRHARRFAQLPAFPSCVRLATALYSSDSRYNVRFSWDS